MKFYKPENKIYLTYKTRMSTEARLRKTGRSFNNLISWYSFSLIVISLSQLSKIYYIHNADFFFTICSIGIFGLSLFVYGERYFEKADQFRNCYLEMQALYESSLEIDEKMKRYAEIRNRYENQIDEDYDDMLFDSWMRGQKLENSTGNVGITWQRAIPVVARRVVRYSFFSSLFCLPVLVLLFGQSVDPKSLKLDEKTEAVAGNGS